MAIKTTKEGKSFWIDPEGCEVPTKYISDHDKKKDALVENLSKKAASLSLQLADFKKFALDALDKHLARVANSYNEDWKGNAIIYNFSANLAVEIKISNKLAFDERLNVAKTKIDNYIMSLVKNSGKEIVLLITKAFKVDKKGNVDVKQIISLKQIDIKHPEWQQAMDIIDEALKVEATRRYITFKIKDDEGCWFNIILNFSSI